MTDTLANKFYREYQADLENPYSGVRPFPNFDEYFETHKAGGLGMEELIEFTARICLRKTKSSSTC